MDIQQQQDTATTPILHVAQVYTEWVSETWQQYLSIMARWYKVMKRSRVTHARSHPCELPVIYSKRPLQFQNADSQLNMHSQSNMHSQFHQNVVYHRARNVSLSSQQYTAILRDCHRHRDNVLAATEQNDS